MALSRSRFSLIELVIVTGLLVTGIMFFLAIVLGSRNSSRESSERAQARAAAMARLGELRAMLRDADPVTNHDAQFQKVLNEDSSVAPTLPGTVVLLQETTGARVDATITVTCFTDEPQVNAILAALDVMNIDINGDGDVTDSPVALADMQLIPVRVEVSWLGANSRGTTDVNRIRLGALLY